MMDLPDVHTPPPGPRSRALAARMRQAESPGVTYQSDGFPIFWERAEGALVWDVDGNRYLDLSAGFGVMVLGHCHPRVVAAVREQAARLSHGMGDVHPTELKIQLLEKLAALSPGDLGYGILSCSGSEAVESALKTARLKSGRPGVIAFEGGYHGLGYGALATTFHRHFRAPFADQLGIPVVHLPFPDPYRPPWDSSDPKGAVLTTLEEMLQPPRSQAHVAGAVLLEPIQGRGGVVVPPAGFLSELRQLCDRYDLLLILDEIFTGCGRTGRWFACQEEQVVPDLLCLGKGMTGGLPVSCCLGRPEVMAAWGESTGEAVHTSTFLGNPLAATSALTTLEILETEGFPARAARLGAHLRKALETLAQEQPVIGDIRGRGLLVGVDLVEERESRQPAPQLAIRTMVEGLRRGLILLPGGLHGNVLTLSPPLVIEPEQLDGAVALLAEALRAAASM